MKAIVQDQYGSPDVLELRDIDKPVPKDNEVLVRVHAAGAHIGDWHIMTGLPYLIRVVGYGLRAPKARVRGRDVAGRVEAVGKDVTQFQPGDEVFGTGDGSFAEYVTAGTEKLAPKPADLTFEQAATVPTSGFTALQGLRDKGKVQPMTSSSTPRATVPCRTSGEPSPPGGPLSSSGPKGADGWFGGIDRQLRAHMLSPLVRQRLGTFVSKENGEDLVVLKELIEAGKVTPVIDKTYPLSEAAEAIRHLEQGHARGKVAITV